MDQTPSTFQCPSCGASLVPPAGAAMMKCAYCGSSVIIPNDLRTTVQQNLGNVPSMGLDFGQLFAKAIRMGEVVRLARAGDRTDAVKLYQENTGASQEQAEKIIEAIAEGKSIDDIDPSIRAAAMQQVGEIAEAAREMRTAAQVPQRRSRRSSCSGNIAFLIVVVGLAVAVWKSPGPAHNFLVTLVAQFMEVTKNLVPKP